MSVEVTIDGYDNLVTIFRDLPVEGYRKPVIAAFRKAADPVKKSMLQNLPSNLKQLGKSLKVKPGKGKSMTLAVGFFGRQNMYRNAKGQVWDPYMLLYWHNYGTLSSRSGEHSFKYPRRKISAHKRGGIKAGLFVEKAVEESMPRAIKIFEDSYSAEYIKFLEKRAAK